MQKRVEPGRGRAILIIAMSSFALVLGSALMLAVIRDHRMQTQASCVDYSILRGDGVAGDARVQDGDLIGAGSEAGYEDTAGKGLRRSMGDETAAVRHPETGIAVDPGLPHEPAQGSAADGAGLAISCDPSAMPVALGGGEVITQAGQGVEGGVDHMEIDVNEEIWEAEEEKTEQELEDAGESQNKLAEIVKEIAEIHAGIMEAVFTPQ